MGGKREEAVKEGRGEKEREDDKANRGRWAARVGGERE